MKLSSILHKLINEGRKGETDSNKSKGVILTDKQLCELWSKASNLESALSNFQKEVIKLSNKDFSNMLND